MLANEPSAATQNKSVAQAMTLDELISIMASEEDFAVRLGKFEIYLAFDAGEIEPGEAITRPLLEKGIAIKNGNATSHADNKIGSVRLEATTRMKKEAVSLANRIIKGEIGIVAGCRLLNRLAFAHGELRKDKDFAVFCGITAETNHFPLDDVKESWEAEKFKAKRLEVGRFEDRCRTAVIQACESMVKRFGV